MLKLSEAIRLGAMTGPQTIGALRRGDSTCALGAAYRAAGLLSKGRYRVRIEVAVETFPALRTRVGACPHCALCALDDIGHAVVHLNDVHGWTRERIADWVATVEPAETPDAADDSRNARAVREDCGIPVLSIRASASSSS